MYSLCLIIFLRFIIHDSNEKTPTEKCRLLFDSGINTIPDTGVNVVKCVWFQKNLILRNNIKQSVLFFITPLGFLFTFSTTCLVEIIFCRFDYPITCLFLKFIIILGPIVIGFFNFFIHCL
jgi:hypothetical protein